MNEKNTIVMKAADSGNNPGGSGGSEERHATSEQRRRELADFLRTRREKLKPEQVGITQLARRRTPGLRREEVAELAGVGTTWYTWLEQARDIQPSSEVLRRLGQALQLNPAETRHMYALAGKAIPCEVEREQEEVTPSLRLFIDKALQVPAVVLGQRWDVIGMNESAEQIFPAFKELPPERRNWLYFVFCTIAPREGLQHWEANARRLLAEFRASLSTSLDNPWVMEIVDLLKSESREFAQWWREHDVRDRAPAVIEFNHPEKGRVICERTVIVSLENPRLKVMVFTAK